MGEILTDILDFARDLAIELDNPFHLADTEIQVLTKRIARQRQRIRNLVRSNAASTTNSKDAVNKTFQQIWNICVNIQTATTSPEEYRRLRPIISSSRQLVLELLEATEPNDNPKIEVFLYIVRLRLNLVKMSLDDANLDLETARASLQRIAEYTQLSTAQMANPEVCGLIFEYNTLRIVLSWKEDRLDVADHLCRNILQQLDNNLGTDLIESLCDILFRLGDQELKRRNYTAAVKWLRRASETLTNVESLSPCGSDIREAILQHLIHGLIKVGTPDTLKEVQELLLATERLQLNHLSIWSARLEIIERNTEGLFDTQAYEDALLQYIDNHVPSAYSIDSILHHIYQLAALNCHLAITVIDTLLFSKLIKNAHTSIFGKAIIHRLILSTTKIVRHTSALESVAIFLDKLFQGTNVPLSEDYAGAVYTALWKRIQCLDGKSDQEYAADWCRLAHHPLLGNVGDSQRLWFVRKQISVSLDLRNVQSCYDLYNGLSEASKGDISIQYLMFRVSCIDMNHELCQEIVKKILQHPGRDQVRIVLYACIRDAQRHSDSTCTLISLQGVINSLIGECDDFRHCASLLRSAIRLAVSIQNKDANTDDSTAVPSNETELCDLFEKAATLACQHDETKGAAFTVNELNWFRRHAYNIGVISCEKWVASTLIALFKSCITLSQCYGDTHPRSIRQELSLMTMRCHFMLSSIRITSARHSQEDKSQSYKESRVHFGEYCKILETFAVRNCGTNDRLSSSLAEHIQKHMLLQTSMLYVFEFEAAVMLDDWSNLSQIVQRAHICSDEGVYKAMGNCLLQSQAPVEVLSNVMKQIVNQIYILETFDASRLAKYIRCLFQALVPRGEELAIQLLDQAIQLAHELDEAPNQFPPLEARWMVATSFNHAVDHYVQGDNQRCKEWALRAIDLAAHAGDDGLLKKAVESRYSELKLDNENR